MLRIAFLLVLCSVFVINSANITAVLDITGNGLILNDDTNPLEKKYSYKFKEPEDLELVCTLAHVFGEFELTLQDLFGSKTCEEITYHYYPPRHHSVRHTFKLTPESGTISCIVNDLKRMQIYISTVDLKYEPDSTSSIYTTAVIDITGRGLTLNDGTKSYNKKYSYKFKKPEDLELNCTVAGVNGLFEMTLQDERGIGTRREKLSFYPYSRTVHSVSHTFKLTSESRTISCTARNVVRHVQWFTSTVDLKYEPDSTTSAIY